ncbi:MAG: hypothetical protein J6X97_02195 [Lachnospiraceae bacterium]|nr:hypothetical protein [Lachnospiraceae bacterium]
MSQEKKKKFDIEALVYYLSFIALITVGMIRVDGNGAMWAAAINCVGFCLLPMIVLRFGAKSFLKIPYLIWAVIGAAASVLAIKYYAMQSPYYVSRACRILEIYAYGFVFIRLIYALIRKEFKGKAKTFSVLFFVTVGFFLLAFISRGRSDWTLYYGCIFAMFFIAPVGKETYEKMFVGMTQAVITGFFIIQGLAFFFRPYDQVRYVGFYNNANVNALFYVVFYIGWLCAYAYFRRKTEKKGILLTIFFFASAMWSFLLLTMTRSAMMSYAFLTLGYFIVEEFFVFKKGIAGFFKQCGIMLLMAVISFPLVFACVRYLPTVIPHNISIDDYHRPNAVRGSDPWNSEKYIEIDEFFEGLLGRVENVDTKSDAVIIETILLKPNYTGLKPFVNTEKIIDEKALGEFIVMDERVISYEDNIVPGTDEDHPAYLYEQYRGLERVLGIRKYIYDFYIRRFNFAGHDIDYKNYWLLNTYSAPHAHNSYIQFTYSFGIIAGVVFFVLSMLGIVLSFIKFVKNKENTPWYYLVPLLFHIGIFGVSLLENIAFPGRFILNIFFISLIPFIRIIKEKTGQNSTED